MKKKFLALTLAILVILSLAGCGSSAKSQAETMEAPSMDMAFTAAQGANSGAYNAYDEAEPAAPDPATPSDLPPDLSQDKIIYSSYADIETTDFDASAKAVDALIKRSGGFLESSSVTGSNYSSGRDYRSASYTIRIPAAAFDEVKSSLSELGNVTYQNTNAQNITTQYYDTSARLEAYQVEYDRLMDMLAKSSTVEEMLAIEQRLSDVRYSIESLTTTIKGWDSLVNYSTLELQLIEVTSYSSAEGAQVGYWESVGNALSGTFRGLGRFFKSALRFIIAALPVLVILAVAAAVVIFAVRRSKARKAAKALPREDKKEE